MTRGPRNLPPTDGRSAENKGRPDDDQVCYPSASCSSRDSKGIEGIDTNPKSKNSTKLPAFSAGFPFDPEAITPQSSRLKSSHRALISSSGSCQRAQVVSPHVPRAQRCRLLEGRPVEQENVAKESEATRKILTRSSLLSSRCASKGSIGHFSALGTYLLCPQPTVNAAHATT
jgi:hypothetical protein